MVCVEQAHAMRPYGRYSYYVNGRGRLIEIVPSPWEEYLADAGQDVSGGDV